MLHDVTDEGGLGFCHPPLDGLLPPGYHGPLVVALDSNVPIDLQQHGKILLNDGMPGVDDDAYAKDLAGVAELVNLWLLRDIRFIVTPRSLTDAKKITQRFLDRRAPSVAALAESLAFQFGDWTIPAPSHSPGRQLIGNVTGLPQGPDRDLVLEAQAVRAHVFLTRDQKVLAKTTLIGPRLALRSPHVLSGELLLAGVDLFGGGTCGAGDCPYTGWSMPAPDIGRWGGLLSIFEDE